MARSILRGRASYVFDLAGILVPCFFLAPLLRMLANNGMIFLFLIVHAVQTPLYSEMQVSQPSPACF